MTRDKSDQVREKDHAVLRCIQDGYDNTREIRRETTLSNRDVNYCLDKLEELGLIKTETPDGRVTETIDGQKRNFKAPRQARLTDTGIQYLAQADHIQIPYRDMTYDELVERVRTLEDEIDTLQDQFDAFRQQVLRKLE